MKASRLLSLNKNAALFTLPKNVVPVCQMQEVSSRRLDLFVGAKVVPTTL